MALEDVSEDQVPKEVRLVSSDGHVFVANRELLMEASGLLKNLLEDLPKTTEVPVQNVTGSILAMVVEYIKAHEKEVQEEASRKPKKSEKWLKEFDAEFVNVDQSTLFELILEICGGGSQRFHIKNDYSPEEEDEVRRANQWAFE